MEASSLLVNAELERAAVSGEEHCVTNLTTTANETTVVLVINNLAKSFPSYFEKKSIH